AEAKRASEARYRSQEPVFTPQFCAVRWASASLAMLSVVKSGTETPAHTIDTASKTRKSSLRLMLNDLALRRNCEAVAGANRAAPLASASSRPAAAYNSQSSKGGSGGLSGRARACLIAC